MNNVLANTIAVQLEVLKIKYSVLTEIRSKDGISIFHVTCDDKSYILKYFANEADRREINNYQILTDLGLPTIQVMGTTECALLMEDIRQSKIYRLGVAEDLGDTAVATCIAKWYKLLHSRGKAFVAKHASMLYDETDVITKENINFIKSKMAKECNPVWNILLDNYEVVKKRINQLPKTLTYNDFYYTNLIVSKDKSTAFMFDYNLLGKGYIYSDLRNVCSSLHENVKTTFLKEYGEFDRSERDVDDIASVLITLYFAFKRDVFPKWAEEAAHQVEKGVLLNSLYRLGL